MTQNCEAPGVSSIPGLLQKFTCIFNSLIVLSANLMRFHQSAQVERRAGAVKVFTQCADDIAAFGLSYLYLKPCQYVRLDPFLCSLGKPVSRMSCFTGLSEHTGFGNKDNFRIEMIE